ncbi:MAG: general stress protein [Phycisphaerae bacterium]|nr:general stress protein [Gemmatimonadaceae bacterium]
MNNDKTTTTSSMLTGSFRDRQSAESAYNSLLARGYSSDEINVMMSPETRKTHFTDDDKLDLGNKSAEGGATGAAVGGVLGTIVGVIAAAGTLAIPGIGIVLAGPVVAGLAGLGAGGAAGGLIGALVGLGIPEDRAKLYETDIKNGGIVLGTTPRSDEDAAYLEEEWRKSGQNVYR